MLCAVFRQSQKQALANGKLRLPLQKTVVLFYLHVFLNQSLTRFRLIFGLQFVKVRPCRNDTSPQNAYFSKIS